MMYSVIQAVSRFVSKKMSRVFEPGDVMVTGNIVWLHQEGYEDDEAWTYPSCNFTRRVLRSQVEMFLRHGHAYPFDPDWVPQL